METVLIRFTRPDYATMPGGIIMRKREDSFGVEYVVHSFARDRGSKEPTSFFWGRYHRDEAKAQAAFNDKVSKAERYTTGGSLIPDYRLEAELVKELENVEAR